MGLPICSKWKIKSIWEKSTFYSKTEKLISRIIISSTSPGEVILDPFLGTGTTAVVAKKHGRKWIGIEKEIIYVNEANKRIKVANMLDEECLSVTTSKKDQPRIPCYLGWRRLFKSGRALFDGRQRWFAKIRIDGTLFLKWKSSIHSVGAKVQGLPACNGWTFWHTKYKGSIVQIDTLRTIARDNLGIQ